VAYGVCDLKGLDYIMRFSSVLLLSTAVLSGCTVTSSSGPDFRSIESQASVKLVSDKKGGNKGVAGIDYALIEINSRVLGYIGGATGGSMATGFGGGRGGPPSLPLGVGDVVQVSVFESQAGGLFIPQDAGSRPGNYVSLPNQTIARDGTVSVPYAGRVRAAGRSVEEVQADLEERLANRAIEPQVMINKISSRSAQVSVLGDVKSAAKIDLTDAGERILDVISEAGGLSSPGIESYVTLIRNGRSAKVHYDYLTSHPQENIYVMPGDVVMVDRERRTFMAFGASGLNGRFDFEESELKLSDALGKAGGLLDSRADPAQVFLYRVVNRDLLVKLGLDTSKFIKDEVPVIFRANLRDPATFFAVQKFPMQDKDIVYVTNSDAIELYKVLDLVGSVPATAADVSSDVLATRTSVRALKN
jgi:polysaccharide export outer membrane protein